MVNRGKYNEYGEFVDFKKLNHIKAERITYAKDIYPWISGEYKNKKNPLLIGDMLYYVPLRDMEGVEIKRYLNKIKNGKYWWINDIYIKPNKILGPKTCVCKIKDVRVDILSENTSQKIIVAYITSEVVEEYEK